MPLELRNLYLRPQELQGFQLPASTFIEKTRLGALIFENIFCSLALL